MSDLHRSSSGAALGGLDSLKGVSAAADRTLTNARDSALRIAGKIASTLVIGTGLSLAAIKAAPTVVAAVGGVAGVKAAIKAALTYTQAMNKLTQAPVGERVSVAAKSALIEAGVSLRDDAVNYTKAAFQAIRNAVVGVSQSNRVTRSIEQLERMETEMRQGLTDLSGQLGPTLVKEIQNSLGRVGERIMAVKEGTMSLPEQLDALRECRSLHRGTLAKLAVREISTAAS